MNKILIAVVFSFVSLSVFAQEKKQEVEQTINNLRQAMLDGDSAKLDQLTDSELTYGHSLGKLENKQEFIHALASGASDFETMDISDQTILIKNKTAIVRHKVTANIKEKGAVNTVKLVIMLVLVKNEKHWRLLARQAVRPQS